MHSCVQYNIYESWGLPVPDDFDEAFVDSDRLSINTGKSFVANDIGSQVFLIAIFGDPPTYWLWETFIIDDVEPYETDDGKTRFDASGPGWMLNPPQQLTGSDFDNFFSRYPTRFGFQRIDDSPYLERLKRLAEEHHRDDWDDETFAFCNRLRDLVPASETRAYRLLQYVKDYLNPPEEDDLPEDEVPKSRSQAVERITRAVKLRRGQPRFRQSLLRAYNGRCAITGCDAEPALEAAHIMPYNGEVTNTPSNGLLLRGDIHTLFDLGLIRIDPETRCVVIESSLFGTSYHELSGRRIADTTSSETRPAQFALVKRWNDSRVVESDL